MAEIIEENFDKFGPLHDPNTNPDTDFHYACAAASRDGISVVCYEVTQSKVTVGVIHQSHIETDPASGEGKQVQNRTEVPRDNPIPRQKFRFGQPSVSPSGKVTLLDGGHCIGPHEQTPKGTIYIWRQGPNGEGMRKLVLPEGRTRIEHVHMHIFDDETAYITKIGNMADNLSQENVDHLKCNLRDETTELFHVNDNKSSPFIMKSRNDEQVVIFEDHKEFFVMNGLDRPPELVQISSGSNDSSEVDDFSPIGIKCKTSIRRNHQNGNGIGNGDPVNYVDATAGEERRGTMVIKRIKGSYPGKTCFYLIKEPEFEIERIGEDQRYHDVQQESAKFAISDDGRYLAIAVKYWNEDMFVDIYDLSTLSCLRLKPEQLYSGFDKTSDENTVSEIGALIFTPETTNKSHCLAVAFRTKTAYFVTFHEVSCNGDGVDKPKIVSTKYAMLKNNLSVWDKKKRPRYYNLQASQDFMIVAGSNIGAFIVQY